MYPREFTESNTIYAKNQSPYLPLPAFTDGEKTVTCWRLTWRERVAVLFGCPVWLSVLNFGAALQPQKPSILSPFVKS